MLEFTRYERLVIDGIEWSVDHRTSTGFVLVGIADRFNRAFTTEELVNAWSEGRLARQARETPPGRPDFLTLPKEVVEQAVLRRACLEALSEQLGPPPYSDLALGEIAAKLPDLIGKPSFKVSRTTLRRWIALDYSVGHDLAGLAPRTYARGRRGPALERKVEDLICAVLDERIMRQQPDSGEDAFKNLQTRLARENQIYSSPPLAVPSRATFYRRVAQLDDAERITRQEGARTRDQKYRRVGPGPNEDRPYGVLEIDHTRVDVRIVWGQNKYEIGRPWLSVAIDRATAMVAGFILTWETPSAATLMLLLRHVMMQKSYVRDLFPSILNDWPCFSKPALLVCDNGFESHSNHAKNAFAALDVGVTWCPTRSPEMKGRVERFFRTLNQGLFHYLPGTTLSGVDKSRDRDLSMRPTVSLPQLNELIHRFIVDIYHQRIHRGLHEPPISRWKKLIEIHPLRLGLSPKQIDLLIARVVTRRPSRRGIELEKLFYNSAELAQLRIRLEAGEKVTVRYDPLDLGRVYVLDPNTDQHFEVPCTDPTAVGRTIWQQEALMRALAGNAKGASQLEVAQATTRLHQEIDEIIKGKRSKNSSKQRAIRHIERPQTPDRLGVQISTRAPHCSRPAASVSAPLIRPSQPSASIDEVASYASRIGMRATKRSPR